MFVCKNNKEYKICLFFSIKLGAIYCRRTKMQIGVKTLKTAVINDVMNKTCCMVDWNDPGGEAFALYFRAHRWAFDSFSATTPRNLRSIRKKKRQIPGGLPKWGGEGSWN